MRIRLLQELTVIPMRPGSFGEALDALRTGEIKGIAREGWNGRGMFISIVDAGERAARGENGEVIPMAREVLYLKTVRDGFVPWCPSQTDILADDWVVVQAGERVGKAEVTPQRREYPRLPLRPATLVPGGDIVG